MTTNKSDKPLAIKTSAFCAIVIIGFHIAFGFGLKNAVSLIIDGVGIGLFIYQSIRAYNLADDGNKDNSSRVWLIVFALFILIWLGGWAAYQNEYVK